MKSKNIFKRLTTLLYLSLTSALIINCSSNKTSGKNFGPPENVFVMMHHDSLPSNSKFIKDLKIGYFPPYISQYRNYDSLIVDAKKKGSEVGGNILQIISHSPYQLNFEKKDFTFHKIKAKVFYSENPMKIQKEKKFNFRENESILNFYMLDQSPLVKKNIYINDSIVIPNFTRMSKRQYKIKKTGMYVFKFGKNGVPLTLELKENQIYYLKCYMKMGMLWSKPVIQEVKDSTEYESY